MSLTVALKNWQTLLSNNPRAEMKILWPTESKENFYSAFWLLYLFFIPIWSTLFFIIFTLQAVQSINSSHDEAKANLDVKVWLMCSYPFYTKNLLPAFKDDKPQKILGTTRPYSFVILRFHSYNIAGNKQKIFLLEKVLFGHNTKMHVFVSLYF